MSLIKGVRVAPTAPFIPHLFYADDSLLFLELTSDIAAVLKSILEIYGELTGQLVNFQKSAITFSPNTPDGVKDEVYS